MSLVTVKSSAAATAPKVWIEDGALIARTSLLWQVLSLFSWCKTVVVDPRDETVVVTWRFLWGLTKSRTVRFRDISHIEYRYGSLATAWDLFGNTQDRVERYTVDLALTDNDELHLFSFAGEGSATTGAVGVLLGDSLVDVEGDQGKQSLGYVDAIQEMTGKGLSKFSKPNKYRR